jgi:hypothetical protein
MTSSAEAADAAIAGSNKARPTERASREANQDRTI